MSSRRCLPLLWLVLFAAACGGAAAPAEGSRYPEKKRPEPARSASDGEVLGANRQAPEDTLEASATTAHPAPGWRMENGVPVPDKEQRDCIPRSEAAASSSDGAPAAPVTDKSKRTKPLCPPAARP